jgi:hypothetical protein
MNAATKGRLTPALRRLLELISEGGERGRFKREIDASDGRSRRSCGS